MQDNKAIPQPVLMVAIPSMLAGLLSFWLLAAFGIDMRVERSAGLVLGAGIFLVVCVFGFGKFLKWWLLAPLAIIGTFLFVIGGTALIH